ncbi:hypothetical protein [Nocardia terpenica]|uniref:Helix-turn-helix domain-containing protein n=1 Tax=Nocardia terpenica TaxID=455432 RepID=A0A6G9YVE3_9NOCA|nr:hypothetical protein [Nocardia terpenica]QIS17309.1 hypothetical protein F6W96_02265 [Nocardia terpenica]
MDAAVTGHGPKRTRAQEIAPEVARLHAQGFGRNEIARALGASAGIVSKAAELVGVSFNASATAAAATEVCKATAQQRRAQLVERLLEVASDALDRPESSPRELRDLAIVAGVAIDKSLKLDSHEQADAALSAVDGWLTAMLGDQATITPTQ